MRVLVPIVYSEPKPKFEDCIRHNDRVIRRIGFATWNPILAIDHPEHDTETFAEQEARLHDILALPEDEAAIDEPDL